MAGVFSASAAAATRWEDGPSEPYPPRRSTLPPPPPPVLPGPRGQRLVPPRPSMPNPVKVRMSDAGSVQHGKLPESTHGRGPGRVDLYVPYEQRAEAKRYGAKFDSKRKRWYAPSGEAVLVSRWGSTARSQDRVYLEIPFRDNAEARARGAKWDRRANLWFDPTVDAQLTKRWREAGPTRDKSELDDTGTRGHPGDRTYLKVPFKEKEEAKKLRACWDPNRKLWFLPPSTPPQLWLEATARWQILRTGRGNPHGRGKPALSKSRTATPMGHHAAGASVSSEASCASAGGLTRDPGMRTGPPGDLSSDGDTKPWQVGSVGEVPIFDGYKPLYDSGDQRFRYYAVREGVTPGIYKHRSGALASRPRTMRGFNSIKDAYIYLEGVQGCPPIQWFRASSRPRSVGNDLRTGLGTGGGGKPLHPEAVADRGRRPAQRAAKRRMQRVLEAPGIQVSPNTKTHSSTTYGGGGSVTNTWLDDGPQYDPPMVGGHGYSERSSQQGLRGRPRPPPEVDRNTFPQDSVRQPEEPADVGIGRAIPMPRPHLHHNPWQAPPQPPACPMLTSSSRREVALWRKKLQLFEEELFEYNQQYGQRHDPALRKSVHPSVWAIISEQLLLPHDRSYMGSAPNHTAVETYLRGLDDYVGIHGRPGEVYCADPLAGYRALQWPDVTSLSYVTAFDIYNSRWREFTLSLTRVDRPEDAELVPVMTAAVRPHWLRDTITAKIATGKGPNLVGPTTRWRKLAKENITTLMTVIRENAEMAEMLRGTDALSRWVLPVKVPVQSSAMTPTPIPALGREVTVATTGPTQLSQPSLAEANGAAPSGVTPAPARNATAWAPAPVNPPPAARPQTVPAPMPVSHPPPPAATGPPAPTGTGQVPRCSVAGCNNRCGKRKFGSGYFNTCYTHSVQAGATAPGAASTNVARAPPPTEPPSACLLAGCNRPREVNRNGGYFRFCCREHANVHRSSLEATAATEEAAAKAMTSATATAPPPQRVPAPPQRVPRICFFCGGPHVVSMCPKLTPHPAAG